AATSAGKASGLKHGSDKHAAAEVGKKLAEKAKEKGISKAAFDRGSYRFHGRIEALAVAATQAGLVCTDLESLKAKHAAKAPAEAAAPEKAAKPKVDKAEAKARADAAKKEKAEKAEKK
ncbi:MAG TPA: 50S ribosomal protein L18, partial [Urbifossiella sp.]